ncbi:hypothetical protein Q7689_35775, partial [Nocardiopsis tropica]|nr:hypothetical protein [Nocardiopsis tropica]
VFAVGAARDLGLGWARRRAVRAAFWLLALALIAYGLATEAVGLTLVPGREGDALRYSAAESSVPIPSVTAIVVLILVGAALLVRARSAWMLLGSVFMFATAAAPSAPLAVGNLGEVALIAGLALTAWKAGGAGTPARQDWCAPTSATAWEPWSRTPSRAGSAPTTPSPGVRPEAPAARPVSGAGTGG